MKINTKQIAVMQVVPHLNSGGLVSGAVEVAKELVNSNYTSLVVSSGGYKENEILRNDSILEKLPVHSKNIFTIFNNKKTKSDKNETYENIYPYSLLVLCHWSSRFVK